MRRGFSLAECLLTMFLMVLVLACATGLMSSYSSVMRKTSGHQNTLSAAVVGLERIGAELSQSYRISSPTSGVASLVEFYKVDPAVGLPAPVLPRSAGSLTQPPTRSGLDTARMAGTCYASRSWEAPARAWWSAVG